jgi:peptidoglycan hydrolase-like protein with peptidoglycan-binding domain
LLHGAVAAQQKGAASPAKPSGTQQAPAKSTAKKSSSAAAKKAPAKKSASRSRRSRGQAAPTADRIKEIQSALAQAGHYRGEPTGKWDAPTATAMRGFQQAQGLKVTGKLDAVTLQKLGLGSPVAGLAPPREPAPGWPPQPRR